MLRLLTLRESLFSALHTRFFTGRIYIFEASGCFACMYVSVLRSLLMG